MAAAGSKDAVFQSEFQATRLKMKKMISLMKEKLRPAAESLANDARRGGTDVEPAKGKKGKGASSSSASAAADADAFEDDEALKLQIMERISKAGDVLAAAYEQLASFEVAKDVAQAMKANPEGLDPAAVAADFVSRSESALKGVRARVAGQLEFKADSKTVAELVTKATGKRARDDDDVEIEADSGGAHNVKCPVTRKLMENPVKGGNCPHVFSQEGIESLFVSHAKAGSLAAFKAMAKTDERFGSIKCPVAGCNRFVQFDELIEDMDTVVAVEAHRRKQEATRQRKRELEEAREEEEEEDDDER